VKKVALIAGPGAGKTTLANALTAHMKNQNKNWYNVGEYARDFIDQFGADKITSMAVAKHIADKQLRRELKVPKSADGFVTDSPMILPWFYARQLPGSGIEKVLILSDLYKMFLRSFLEYDLIVYVEREKPYLDDGTRFQTPEEASTIDEEVLQMVLDHGFEVFRVRGPLETRVKLIAEELDVR
jgi:nicotinamide riboside kinase